VSKGQEAVALLQRFFGERVDPGKALAFMMGKINSQAEMIEGLKDLLCAMAWDHGALLAILDLQESTMGDPEKQLSEFINLPRVALRAEVVKPNQPPAVRLT
jgi:hypothetical protein